MKPSAGALAGGESYRVFALVAAVIIATIYIALAGVPEVLLP